MKTGLFFLLVLSFLYGYNSIDEDNGKLSLNPSTNHIISKSAIILFLFEVLLIKHKRYNKLNIYIR